MRYNFNTVCVYNSKSFIKEWFTLTHTEKAQNIKPVSSNRWPVYVLTNNAKKDFNKVIPFIIVLRTIKLGMRF